MSTPTTQAKVADDNGEAAESADGAPTPVGGETEKPAASSMRIKWSNESDMANTSLQIQAQSTNSQPIEVQPLTSTVWWQSKSYHHITTLQKRRKEGRKSLY